MDPTMGLLATDNAATARKYGDLGVRFNTLRGFYRCVRTQLNQHKTADGCVDAISR